MRWKGKSNVVDLFVRVTTLHDTKRNDIDDRRWTIDEIEIEIEIEIELEETFNPLHTIPSSIKNFPFSRKVCILEE